jgi:hypothetical protein
MRWDEVWTKAQAWGCPCHPKKYPISISVKAWDAQDIPFFINKNIRSSLKTLYFYCFIYYVLFLERRFFCFLFFFFAVINGLCGRKTRSAFSCEYSYSSLIFTEYSCLAIAMLLAPVFHTSLVQSLLVFFSYICLLSGLYLFLSMRVLPNKLIGVG